MSSISKVVYKPDSQSTDEYIVIIADQEAFKKWKEGDTTIPLVEFVDSFDIFHTGQGAQGILNRASKQQLDTIFESHKDVDCVEKILREGRLDTSKKGLEGFNSRNDQKGGQYQVSSGSVAGGHGGR